MENLGLKEFVTYDDKGEIEGIAYDRLWILFIPVYQRTTTKNQEAKKTRDSRITNKEFLTNPEYTIHYLSQEIMRLTGRTQC